MTLAAALAAPGANAQPAAPLAFRIVSRTPMTDTNVFPLGTVKITYRSAADGQEDWALFCPGDCARNAVIYLHGSFSSGDQLFTRKSSQPVLKKLAETVFAAYGGTPEELPAVYRARSVLEQADKLNMPIVLTLGEKDALIPAVETRKLVAALKDKPRFQYREIPGGNHDSALWVDIDLNTLQLIER